MDIEEQFSIELSYSVIGNVGPVARRKILSMGSILPERIEGMFPVLIRMNVRNVLSRE